MNLNTVQRVSESWHPSFGTAPNRPVVLPLMLAARLYFVLMVLRFVAFNSGIAMAQSKCGDRTTIAKSLRKNFKESPIANGITKDGVVIEIFASVSGSWTMILTLPNGQSCFLAAGESWENLPILTKGPSI